jgi:hypothetical protein
MELLDIGILSEWHLPNPIRVVSEGSVGGTGEPQRGERRRQGRSGPGLQTLQDRIVLQAAVELYQDVLTASSGRNNPYRQARFGLGTP